MRLLAALRRRLAAAPARVGATEAAALVRQGALLLDVREPAEWAAGHAPQARHIPLGQLAGRLAELPADRPVVTVCRSGARSARAAALLARQGRPASNLAGGMHAWAAAGLPVVDGRGRAGRVA
ncbi:MAG: rhodanese-like domain-containing protein [Actinomycetota bacterium]